MSSSDGLSRRAFLGGLAFGAASFLGRRNAAQQPVYSPTGIRRWDHRFLFFGDALVSVPGEPCYQHFSSILTHIASLNLRPDFLLSGGDDIYGHCDTTSEIEDQWASVLGLVHASFGREIPFYGSPSNHNNMGVQYDSVWRRQFSYPSNGAPGQEKLSYWIRRGDLLLAITHQADERLGGPAHVESDWLDRILRQHVDARYKVVVGHYPALAVNGLRSAPLARLVEPDRKKFWSVLVRNGVQLYLCSHIQSFDARARDGVLQVCSAAACNGSRPPDTEYQHITLFTLVDGKLSVNSIDAKGVFRESFSWSPPVLHEWRTFSPESLNRDLEELRRPNQPWAPPDRRQLAFRIRGPYSKTRETDQQTLVCGYVMWQATETIWVGLVGSPARLAVRLQPRHYFWQQEWLGPAIEAGEFDYTVLLDSSMGPGGVLWRVTKSGERWTSFESSCSSGLENLRWPDQWQTGHGIHGKTDKPGLGAASQIEYYIRRIAWNKD